MPRLSIIVPHISTEASLEATLLSVLENRPQGCELLAVHSGDYSDPYDLDHDEIRLIEAPNCFELTSLVNEAVRQSQGKVIHTLLPEMEVASDWTAPALAWFQDSSVGSVAPSLSILENKKQIYSGLDPQCLPRRSWSSRIRRGENAIASLCGGFYRRQTLQALEGWIASGSREGAEAELGLAMQALSMKTVAEPESQLFGPRKVIEGQMGGYALGNYAGKLAMAYSQLLTSNLASDSLAARIGHLAGGLISPTSVAERLGWVLGLTDRTIVADVRTRIEAAEDFLNQNALRQTATQPNSRRAA